MQLPNSLPANQRDRENLGSFYDAFATQQWFVRAELNPNSVEHKLDLEVHVNYNPLLMMKDLLGFAHKHDYNLKIVDLSHKS